ncbi:hypothetical protein [Rubricoccus marinus]|uniref:Uncharacterized protein n=1 Tax=Rubricoccus marinus TaxID=716817 RepID=A0A259TYN4_9BACT|nr:hypothetical protein [Rubricoccus marinus]OZC02885.1 hypothetical protein BSZ36_07815 [Rubricoccus marinus]
MRVFPLFLLSAVLITGCGLFGGARDLTAIEVAGRYEFTEYSVEPTAGSVDSKNLRGRELPRDVTLVLNEAGEARVERLRGERVDGTLASGSYVIRGREVRIEFSDLGDLGRDVLMPRSITFDADGRRMEADIFLEGVNLEDLSDDYRGITRADVRLLVELRKMAI